MKLQHYGRFTRYVLLHKWFVFRAGLVTGAPLLRLFIHDFSKFTPIEYFSYTEFFNGDKSDPRVKRNFELGKVNHLRKNAHHWEYWVVPAQGDPSKLSAVEMPEAYVREMVADWFGAGRAHTGNWDTPSWYEAQKHTMVLHEKTRELAETILAEAAAKLMRAPALQPAKSSP